MSSTKISLEALLKRNRFQQRVNSDRKEFNEEIKIDVHNCCLQISVRVGDCEGGFFSCKHVYEGECFFEALNEFYDELLKYYDDETKSNR